MVARCVNVRADVLPRCQAPVFCLQLVWGLLSEEAVRLARLCDAAGLVLG